jgi:hypothetical protein
MASGRPIGENALVTEQEHNMELRCHFCGAPAAEGWLGIQTWRDNGGTYKDLRVDVEDLGFCGQEHAGRYFLDGRLPAPDFSEPPTLPRTWRDRLFDVSLPMILLPAVILILIGGWTIAQWLLH